MSKQSTTAKYCSVGTDAGHCRYLEHEFLTSYKHSNIVLLRPSMAMMLMQTPDPRTIKAGPLSRQADRPMLTIYRRHFQILLKRLTSSSPSMTLTTPKLLRVAVTGHFCSSPPLTVLHFITTRCLQEIREMLKLRPTKCPFCLASSFNSSH
jgi:hypothetical protein